VKVKGWWDFEDWEIAEVGGSIVLASDPRAGTQIHEMIQRKGKDLSQVEKGN
jgi:hypothetical protein